MVKCKICGTENPENAKFCLNCGSPLTQEAQQNLLYNPYYHYYAEYWRWYYHEKKMEEIRKRKSFIATTRVLIMIASLCILTPSLITPLFILVYPYYVYREMYTLVIIGIILGLFAGFLGLFAAMILEGKKEKELWIASSASASQFVASFYISTWILYSPLALLCVPAIVLSFLSVILLASKGYNIIKENNGEKSQEVFGKP